ASSTAAGSTSGSYCTMTERNVGTVSTIPSSRASFKPCASANTAALSRRSIVSPNSTMTAVSPAGSTLYSGMTGTSQAGLVINGTAQHCTTLQCRSATLPGVASEDRNQGLTLTPRRSEYM